MTAHDNGAYDKLARVASNYLDAAERYMAGQRLGRMRESHIDDLNNTREALNRELDAARADWLARLNAR